MVNPASSGTNNRLFKDKKPIFLLQNIDTISNQKSLTINQNR